MSCRFSNLDRCTRNIRHASLKLNFKFYIWGSTEEIHFRIATSHSTNTLEALLKMRKPCPRIGFWSGKQLQQDHGSFVLLHRLYIFLDNVIFFVSKKTLGCRRTQRIEKVQRLKIFRGEFRAKTPLRHAVICHQLLFLLWYIKLGSSSFCKQACG